MTRAELQVALNYAELELRDIAEFRAKVLLNVQAKEGQDLTDEQAKERLARLGSHIERGRDLGTIVIMVLGGARLRLGPPDGTS